MKAVVPINYQAFIAGTDPLHDYLFVFYWVQWFYLHYNSQYAFEYFKRG